MRTRNNLLLLLTLQLAIIGRAQPVHMNFTSLTSRDGLLSNTINAILKDRYGFMWFATDDGLNKFDGTNFATYRHIPGDSGSLRANEVLALHEDPKGNLWVATSGGAISLYDRKKDRFVHYPRPGDTSGLVPNAVVRGICSGPGGTIWIAQFAAPYILDPPTGKLTKMDLGYNAGGPSSQPVLECIFADSKSRIWIGTDKGLFLYKPATRSFIAFRHNPLDRTSLIQDQVNALAEDRSGHLWVGTDSGLCMMNADEHSFVPYMQMDPASRVLGDKTINTIVPDADGKLWIGTIEGLHILEPATRHATTFLPDGNVHGLTGKWIKCIYIDKEGIYWLGTFRGGIDKYDKNLNLFDVKLGDAFPGSGTKRPVVTSFAQRPDGKLWVGTDGDGLFLFDRKTAVLKRITLRVDDTQKELTAILALLTARDGRLYIGSRGNGLLVLDAAAGRARHLVRGAAARDLENTDVYSLLEDRTGRIWAGTNGEGVDLLQQGKLIARYTPAPAAPSDVLLPLNGYIRALEQDLDGGIWIGTHGGGLAVLDPKDNRFTIYDQDNSALPIDKVHALLCDSHGRMWVGTYGGGLSVFDKHTRQFTNYTEKDGLQNTTIYCIREDGQDHIWVSTNSGISCFDPNTRSFRNFTGLNGLQNSNFVHGAGTRLPDGQLVFGGLLGFNYFYPSELAINHNVPPVVFTDLQIANKSIQPGNASPLGDQISVAGDIRLEYKQNFALSFVALSYTLPKQDQYAYKLDGFDKDWNFTGAANTARYTNLDPGEYVFRVKASNNDGVWNPGEKTISIYVRPPWWRTMYAYILYVLAAGGLLLYSRHLGLSRVRKKFRLEQERAEITRVQELDRMKLKFLTNLSHEFRTPISLIMGPVNDLLADRHEEKANDKLLMIRRNARRLLNLVNMLLDFRKMEEQELSLLLAPGELVGFLNDVVHSFADLSGRKHIRLHFTTDIPPLYVLFDHDKMERILFNLLSNAFKFTLEGGDIADSLQASAVPCETGTQWVSIRVTDTGIGIPADKLHSIFDRFFQHASGNAVLNQGTGIGLSITREFVRLHGGAIEVDSEPGRGSAFTIRLPLKLAAAKPVDNVALPDNAASAQDAGELTTLDTQPPPHTEKPTVLLIEDNDDFRWYLKDNLAPFYTIIEASDGQQGWQKALAGHPQLIVSDISMPRMDGIFLSKKLKGDKRTCHIPIILLTALTGDAEQIQGLETGANDYITKPFTFQVLHNKIRNLLELRRHLKSTYTRQVQVLQPELTIQTEDDRLLLAIVHCLEEHLANPDLSVEFLSRQIGMSRSSLYSKMLELTGETPVEYIRSFKLERAATLLEKSGLTIAEIAYQTGFSSPNYFARAFKTKFDMIPSEYIAQKRKAGENKNN